MTLDNKNVIFWEFDEYEIHERSTWWYVIAGLVVGGLLVYSIATSNILFAIVVFLAVVTIFVRHSRPPEKIECEISPDGVRIGEKCYGYKDITCFSIIESHIGDPVLYIREARGMRNLLPLPLAGTPREEVQEILREYLEEDTDHLYEPFWDWIGRTLKL